MRKYEDEQQQDSVMFDGDNAEQLKQLRTEMDTKAEAICKEIHSAITAAETKFSHLASEYQPQFDKILASSELKGANSTEVGFDFSNTEKYGVVFAKKIGNPVRAFIDLLRSIVESGPIPSADSIWIEPKDPSAVSKRWGSDQRVDA